MFEVRLGTGLEGRSQTRRHLKPEARKVAFSPFRATFYKVLLGLIARFSFIFLSLTVFVHGGAGKGVI